MIRNLMLTLHHQQRSGKKRFSVSPTSWLPWFAPQCWVLSAGIARTPCLLQDAVQTHPSPITQSATATGRSVLSVYSPRAIAQDAPLYSTQ
jgi:hypothetical protein